MVLPTREKLLILHSIFSLTYFRVKLFCFSSKVLVSLFSSTCKSPQIDHSRNISIYRFLKIINETIKLVPCKTCLSVALAGYTLFEKNGYPPEQHRGAKKNKGHKLEAHEWLTMGGEVVLGDLTDLSGYIGFPLKLVEKLL